MKKKELYKNFIAVQKRDGDKILEVGEAEKEYCSGDYRTLSVGDITKIEKTVVG